MSEYIIPCIGERVIGYSEPVPCGALQEEVVRCAKCVNWGTLAPKHAEDWCPVVSKCTRAGDWCCWGAGKGESDER